MNTVPSSQQSHTDFAPYLRALVLWMIRHILRCAPKRGYVARIAAHALPIAEREVAAWIVVEAAARIAPCSQARIHHPSSAPPGFRRRRARINLRNLCRIARARAPRESLDARLDWLLRALDDPAPHIARVLRNAPNLARLILVPSAPPALGHVCAAAAPHTPAPDD